MVMHHFGGIYFVTLRTQIEFISWITYYLVTQLTGMVLHLVVFL